MKFKIDENLPTQVAELLRHAGHDALTVGQQNLTGAVDSRLADVCQSESRALVTLDLGVADIRTYPPGDYHGLIVLRLKDQSKIGALTAPEGLLPRLNADTVQEALLIVEDRRVRIRR